MARCLMDSSISGSEYYSLMVPLFLYICIYTFRCIYICIYLFIFTHSTDTYVHAVMSPLEASLDLQGALAPGCEGILLQADSQKGLRALNLWWIQESWNMGLGLFVLGSPILYLKGRRRTMFQLSGFYFNPTWILKNLHFRAPYFIGNPLF